MINEQRDMILADYFKVPLEVVHEIHRLPRENGVRKKAACALGLESMLIRGMLDYSRYPDAELVSLALMKLFVKLKGLQVLDFGCLVADYAIFFARQGADVTVYDFAKYLDFVKFRFRAEGLKSHAIKVPAENEELFRDKDLVIFGEVLEHLSDPLEILRACVNAKVQFIFTTVYPYGWDEYFNIPDHQKSAQLQQPDCQALLKRNYREMKLLPDKERRLWVRSDDVEEGLSLH